jgi:hypothetical protein
VKLCWENKLGFLEYGYDDSFGTRIIWNGVSKAVSIRGYWIGI